MSQQQQQQQPGGTGGGGRGTISYDINKPTHSLTVGGTTEWDDELMRRQIVTPHQVFLAKGATPQEANRLATEWTQQQQQQQQQQKAQEESQDNGVQGPNQKRIQDGDSDDDDSFLDDADDDDGFMERYRQERLAELQASKQTKNRQQQLQQRSTYSPMIRHISRQEWTSHVNEQSHDCWVIVCMTEKNHHQSHGDTSSGDVSMINNDNNSSKYHDRVVEELHRISREFNTNNSSDGDGDDGFELVTIYYKDAIPNWPVDRVPTMFAYRFGIKQHEWIAPSRGSFPSRDILEQLFRQWTIIK